MKNLVEQANEEIRKIQAIRKATEKKSLNRVADCKNAIVTSERQYEVAIREGNIERIETLSERICALRDELEHINDTNRKTPIVKMPEIQATELIDGLRADYIKNRDDAINKITPLLNKIVDILQPVETMRAEYDYCIQNINLESRRPTVTGRLGKELTADILHDAKDYIETLEKGEKLER